MKARWALVAIAATTAIVVGASKLAETQPAPAPEGIWGCVYNATPPTLASLQSVQMQCDINGQLKTG